MTNLAEHLENISHDKINYYLKNERLTPRLLWENVKDLIVADEDAYIIFDDTVFVCSMLVWLRLKNLAYQTGQTIYRIKHNLLSNYLIQQLKRPDVCMRLV
ncbi:MAG: hypothetical protein V7L00_10130 [Nostoc sp.]|uniref:hypothetical protein n=1 Tax=Nostoc sp. JL33 TaxID=2815396 RepID=UPI0025F58394|nr:hypothetical protein [Nostoc sp. JL33]